MVTDVEIVVDDYCGDRCEGECGERMCAVYGPEPRACGSTCCECSCLCETCVHVREDMRADLLHRIQGEEGR